MARSGFLPPGGELGKEGHWLSGWDTVLSHEPPLAELYLGNLKRPWLYLSFSMWPQKRMMQDSEDTSCPFLKNAQKCADTSYKSTGKINKILIIIYIEIIIYIFFKKQLG